jgi:hypothetical protein
MEATNSATVEADFRPAKSMARSRSAAVMAASECGMGDAGGREASRRSARSKSPLFLNVTKTSAKNHFLAGAVRVCVRRTWIIGRGHWVGASAGVGGY